MKSLVLFLRAVAAGYVATYVILSLLGYGAPAPATGISLLFSGFLIGTGLMSYIQREP